MESKPLTTYDFIISGYNLIDSEMTHEMNE